MTSFGTSGQIANAIAGTAIRLKPYAGNVIWKTIKALSEEESQTGTLGTLKGVRPVWGRLSRNLHSKECKARLFQSIATN